MLSSATIMESLKKGLKAVFVFMAFCAALALGFVKGLLVGPFAAVVMIVGNIGVLIGMFPAHVCWILYTLFATNLANAILKLVMLVALPVLLALWLALGIAGSVLAGVGYGFFTPWISTFEAFRRNGARDKCYHCLVDGTLETIKGSCIVVRDFADVCYHSFPMYLKELREKNPEVHKTRTIRLMDIPKCMAIGAIGVMVEIPIFTLIVLIKSPYMLFKGWQRLLQDMVRGEGPFLETACVPIAGLAIIFWPLLVVGSIGAAFITGIFAGLYGSIIVYQERSFRRGLAYLVAIVSEFDEYTNDLLYLTEGSIFPRPHYRERKAPKSSELSVGANTVKDRDTSMTPPALLVPSLAPSKSVKEAIQEVKVVQIWGNIMKGCELEGKALIDDGLITPNDLSDWLSTGNQGTIIGLGLPSFSLLKTLLDSIAAGVQGVVLSTGAELNDLNRPNSRLLDWFFHPILVLKEQIKIQNLDEDEVRFLKNITLLGSNPSRMKAWRNHAALPKDPLRAAQIQAISRRLVGMMGSISKLPTYRRKFQQVVKILTAYSAAKEEELSKSRSMRMHSSEDIV